MAGVGFSLATNPGEYDCKKCDERRRNKRNCHNRKGVKYPIAEKEIWHITGNTPHVLKVLGIKFHACPRSSITGKTWQILKLVYETTNENGEMLHLPFEGAYLDQPPWYREAVSVTKSLRNKYREEKNAKH